MVRRYGRVISGVVVMIIVAAAAFWAGRVTLRPQEPVDQVVAEESYVEVTEQELGRLMTLTTTVTRPNIALAQNFLSGVITSIEGNGEFRQGDSLYTVGDTEVFIAEGAIPFWRDLTPGTKGEDVKQLQKMLNALDFDVAENGEWETGTTTAVRAWQRDKGLAVKDEVGLGELVAAPSLPISISFDSEYSTPGTQVAGGETMLFAAAGEPEFEMEVAPGQAEMMPAGTAVEIHHADETWHGVTGESDVGDDEMFTVNITAPDGGSVCGDTCSLLPAGETNFLTTDVELVPSVMGPVVPVSAVKTQPDGVTTVEVVADHEEDDILTDDREVTIVTVADGLASVSGVKPGERVKVFADKPNDA